MNYTYVRMGISINLGLCFGAALGMALHTLGWGSSAIGVGIALGVSLGTMYGAALGLAPDGEARKKAATDKPLPHPLGLS